MEKHILLLSGSPKQDGNTDKMAAAFTEGAKQKGHTVSIVRPADLNIAPCVGCASCLKTKSPCVVKDDMHVIYALFDQCDVVVLASPLYYYHISAQLKAVIDRTFMYLGRYPQKECALLMSANNTSPTIFEAVEPWYDKLVTGLKWNDRGRVLINGLYEKGSVENTDGLEKARLLGSSI